LLGGSSTVVASQEQNLVSPERELKKGDERLPNITPGETITLGSELVTYAYVTLRAKKNWYWSDRILKHL